VRNAKPALSTYSTPHAPRADHCLVSVLSLDEWDGITQIM
jgi:hypothetical protein